MGLPAKDCNCEDDLLRCCLWWEGLGVFHCCDSLARSVAAWGRQRFFLIFYRSWFSHLLRKGSFDDSLPKLTSLDEMLWYLTHSCWICFAWIALQRRLIIFSFWEHGRMFLGDVRVEDLIRPVSWLMFLYCGSAFNAHALAALAEVAGSGLNTHLSTVLPPLVSAMADSDEVRTVAR